MTQPEPNGLTALTGKQITLRFPNAGVTGRLVAANQEPWGYILHLSSPIGDHFVAFPGDVIQIIVAHSDLG